MCPHAALGSKDYQTLVTIWITEAGRCGLCHWCILTDDLKWANAISLIWMEYVKHYELSDSFPVIIK